MDVAIGLGLRSFLDGRTDGVGGYEECAKKGRQCMDIAWVQTHIVEKSMDRRSEGAIAQADIKQFYCHV